MRLPGAISPARKWCEEGTTPGSCTKSRRTKSSLIHQTVASSSTGQWRSKVFSLRVHVPSQSLLARSVDCCALPPACGSTDLDPAWVKNQVDAWTAAAAIARGPCSAQATKAGRVSGDGMSPKVLWDVVRAAAARAGIEKLAPHDLRRTCVRLPPHRRRTESHPFPARSRLDRDDRALPRVQAEASDCRERAVGNRT